MLQQTALEKQLMSFLAEQKEFERSVSSLVQISQDLAMIL